MDTQKTLTSDPDQPPLIKPYTGADRLGMYSGLAFSTESLSGYERDSLYLNVRGEYFVDISGISGADAVTDGRSVVYGDFDNDGDLDFFVTSIHGDTQQLFRNNVGQKSGWLRVVLSGRASGRDAFGAIVRVKYSGGIQTKVKSGGEGFVSQHDPRLLFGLGSDKAVEWVEVSWPSGGKQRFEKIPARTTMFITEGLDSFQPLFIHETRLPDPDPANGGLRLRVGQHLPALELKTLAGTRVTFPVNEGPVVVNLWATWCAACRAEMPALESLNQRGINVVGLNVDDGGSESVRAFIKTVGVRYPIFRLSNVEAMVDRDRVQLPLSIVLDATGAVRNVYAGWSPETGQQIAKYIRDLTQVAVEPKH